MRSLYKKLVECHNKLKRNIVWCRVCGQEKSVLAEDCFRHGWPKCCDQTMTIDSPDERHET